MSFWLIAIVIIGFYYLTSGFRKAQSSYKNNHFSNISSQNSVRNLVALVAKVAKSDGVVNSIEADMISEILSDFSVRYKINRDILKSVYNTEKNRLDNAYNLAMEYRLQTGLNSQEAVNIIIFLLNLAYIDGEFSLPERKIITEIASGLGIDNETKNSIFSKFEAEFNARFTSFDNTNKKSPYEILGVNENASFEEVKKQYRLLVKQNHPDVLMGQGASKSVVSEATKKLQEINDAYDRLRKQKGWR